MQNVLVAPDTTVEAFADGLAVWSKPGSTFARSVEEARAFLALIAAANTLVAGRALDFTFTGWVEATAARFEGTMVGFAVPRGHSLAWTLSCAEKELSEFTGDEESDRRRSSGLSARPVASRCA